MKRSHQAFATPDTQTPGVSRHQVSALLSTCSTLYRDSRALIGRIRGSLGVMQELRSELRHRAQPLNGNAGGCGVAHLQFAYGLTAREAEVALLISKGRSNTAIASALHISTHTARHHTQRVLAKLGVHSRAAAGAAIRR